MKRVIVTHFVTLDGRVEDPDGADGTPGGGWFYRHGPEAVSGDKFETGELLDSAALLLGRRTWLSFAERWPARTTDFAVKMNKAEKVVASRTLTDVGAWNNSTLLTGEVTAEVRRLRQERDVIIIGSVGIVHTLIENDLVDEYRLVVLPTILGAGRRLLPDGGTARELRAVPAEPPLLRYQEIREGQAASA
jgi:dihydrofolate reductase